MGQLLCAIPGQQMIGYFEDGNSGLGLVAGVWDTRECVSVPASVFQPSVSMVYESLDIPSLVMAILGKVCNLVSFSETSHQTSEPAWHLPDSFLIPRGWTQQKQQAPSGAVNSAFGPLLPDDSDHPRWLYEDMVLPLGSTYLLLQ